MLLAVLIIPSIHFVPGYNWILAALFIALIAIILATVNSLTVPLMPIFPFGIFLGVFGIFALVSNSLLLSMTAGISHTMRIPFVINTAGEAATAGAITAVASTIIVAFFAKDYRD